MVRALDKGGRLAILPFADELAQRLLEPIPPAEREAAVRLALPDGSLLEDGDAIAHVLWLLPATRPAGRLMRAPIARRPLRRLYGVVAANRDHLARLVRDRPAVVRRPGEVD